jgi:glycosidase
VGETFSGDRSLIASYVGDGQLDGQFDFPLYWAIVQAFARDEIGLSDGAGSLEAEVAASKAAFGDHLMGTFLGNHDVTRFLAQASGQVDSLYGDGLCGDDGSLRAPGTAPDSAEPYQRLMLAWSFLLTTEGLPLIYYGDEIGMPGLMDPDNRQMMRFDDDLSDNERTVLAHVRALGQARREHPAFSRGTTTQWWENEAGVWAYSRVEADDAVLVVLNRDASARSLSNGLAFADLPSGTYVDVLTGQTFTPVGDTLTVEVPALGSRVLVLR